MSIPSGVAHEACRREIAKVQEENAELRAMITELRSMVVQLRRRSKGQTHPLYEEEQQ